MILWEPTRIDAFKVLFRADRRRIGGRGHFPSRDKDGGHTVRSAVSDTPLERPMQTSRLHLL